VAGSSATALPGKASATTTKCGKKRAWQLVAKRDFENLSVRQYAVSYKGRWLNCNVAKERKPSSKTIVEVITHFTGGLTSTERGRTKVESYNQLERGECLAADFRLKRGKKTQTVVYGATICSQ